MKNSEMGLYQEMIHWGLKLEVLEYLPFDPVKVLPFYDDGFIIETTHDKMVLWIFKGSENDLINLFQIFQICQQQGVKGLLYQVMLSNEQFYAKYDEQSWFYITPWPNMGKVYFSCIEQLKAIVNLMVEFRRAISESDLSINFDNQRPNNLLEKFQDVIVQIHSFELLAKYRLHPSLFDKLFLSYISEIKKQANEALMILDNSDYRNILTRLSTKNIIINKLTRHNLRMNASENGICLSLDSWQWNLPIIDLAILLMKSGRSNKWSINWFETLMKRYQSYYEINEDEYKIILAYLIFPWSLYRLVSRYYYNRVEWPLRTYVGKMERLLRDEPVRRKFLNKIH